MCMYEIFNRKKRINILKDFQKMKICLLFNNRVLGRKQWRRRWEKKKRILEGEERGRKRKGRQNEEKGKFEREYEVQLI